MHDTHFLLSLMFFLTCVPVTLSPFYTEVLHITSPTSVTYTTNFFSKQIFSQFHDNVSLHTYPTKQAVNGNFVFHVSYLP